MRPTLFAVFLLATAVKAATLIEVPFLPQVPPPETPTLKALNAAWHKTHNCGQTSVLMVMGYHSRQTPTANDIMHVDDFLLQQFGDPVNSYYGSFTGGNNTNRLIAIAQRFGDRFGTFQNTTTPIGTMPLLMEELANGYPVIVGVWTKMCVACVDMRGLPTSSRHWMVMVGLDATSVYMNDPGLTNGKAVAYSLNAFQAAWKDQGFAVILIHPSAPTTGSVTVSATLDGNSQWSSGPRAPISYSIAGGPSNQMIPGTTNVPFSLSNLQFGSYTLNFSGGGPLNSTLMGVLPCGLLPRGPAPCTGQLTAASPNLPFTLQFLSNPPSAGFTMSSGNQSANDGQTLTVPTSSGNTVSISFDATARSVAFNGNTIANWTWTANNSIIGTH